LRRPRRFAIKRSSFFIEVIIVRQFVARSLLLLFVFCLPLSLFGQDQNTKKPPRSSSKRAAKEVTLTAGEGPAISVKTPIRKDRRTPSAGHDRDEDQGEGDAQPAVAPGFRVMSHPREDRLVRGHDFQGDLRTLPQMPPEKFERPEFEEPKVTPVPYPGTPAGTSSGTAAVTANPPSPSGPAPSPSISFDGLDFANFGAGHPPDTNGDVGPTYYIQTINTSIGIYNKSTGSRVAAFSFNTLMSQGTFGNLCDNANFGDPVVVYDTFEDRWIITDFAFQLSGGNVVAPEFQCFAVSKSGDPVAGGWNFYSIQVNGGFGDYPKFGIWPDGLYMAANVFGFGAGGSFQNVRVWAFNKAQMYAGIPNIQVLSFDAPSAEFTLLPSNARLQTGTPPAGSANYFATVFNFTNAVSIYKFHVDWNNVSTSTFSGPSIAIAPTSWANPPSTVPSGTGGNGLDTLAVRLMVQNQYTNMGGVESLWDSHTIQGTAATNAAPRYYQVDVTGGTVAAATTQASTFNPDASAVNRFMPSVAVDRAGDMAIGYSVSSSTLFPGIRYAGRLAGDPVNSITQTETSLIAGTGTQSGACGSTCTRWGDYSAMTLDPNGCTLWYTNMYYQTTGLSFNTRIGAFSFPSCTPVATGTVSGKVTASGSGNPISGATVALGSRTATTAIDGTYSFAGLPSGTYPSISASFAGFNSSTTLNVVVSDGTTTTANFSLTAAPTSGCLMDTTQADFQAGVPTNCDLTSSPGNVILLNTPTIDQQNTSVTNNGFGFDSVNWAGQTFKAGVTGQLTRVDLDLFCSGCTGTTPNITVSIRATTGATPVPTGADLATATITGFSSGAGGFFTATFSSPPTLTAGTTYAVIFRAVSNPSAGTYAYVCSCSSPDSNPYANGRLVTSANSGATWAADATSGGRDIGFKIFMNAGFASPGTFVSSLKDANPAAGATPTWGTLSWHASTPTNTSIQFQAAATNSASGPFNFVGPDGTTGTFFSNGGSLAQFTGNRYLKYRASLSTSDSTVTPTLNDVTICFSDATSGASTTLVVDPATGPFAGTTNLSATLTAGSVGVSGKTVTFTLNGNSAGSGVTDGTGLATVSGASLTGINAGSYPNGVAATFAGDGLFASSTGSNTLTVSKANQTITFGALAGKTFGDPDFSVSATASSGLAVTFTAGGNCTVIGSTVHLTGVGSCTITASQAGNGNYNPAADVPQSFSIAAATPPTIAKAFGAATVPLNGTTSLTFTIHNPNTTATLTGLAFTDNLPAGLVVASTPNLISTCGGTATAVGGASSVSLSAGTLAASAGCTVSVNVTGTTAGVKNNSVQVTSTEGGTGNTSNASITVVAPPVIIKAFGAASIPLNGTTSLQFTIQNNNTTQALSGIGFSDTLPAGLLVATPNGLTGNTCSTTPTATQGTNVVSLSGASLAASSSCSFSINVTGTTAGTKNNTTGNVTSTEGGTGGTASASINVIAPPSIAKVFNPNAIALNATTSLTFTITNPAANTVAESGLAFIDTLPTGLTVANSSATVCGGTLTTTSPTGIALSGSSIAVNSQCQFSVTVTGAASGQYTNTTGAVSSTNGGTGNTATANLMVASPPAIVKAFGAASVPLNGTTSLTFNINNPNTSATLTGLAFTDNLPAGLVVASPANLNDTCGGAATAVGGSGSVSLSGGTVAPSGSCAVSVNVTGTTAGVKNNSVQVTSTEGGTGNTSNASITVAAPPVIIKAFGAASIPLNGTTSLTFTIQNNNTGQALSGIGFSDTLPAGLLVATPNGLTGNTCSTTPTATQGTNVVSLSGASLAASSSCSFSINVTGTTAGPKNNTTGNVTSTEGGTGGTASASVNVVAPPSIAKAFGATAIPLNGTTSLTFTITNPAANTVAENGLAFTDTLPTGLVVATPNGLINNCGGTATAVAGSTSITLTGGSLAVTTSCTVIVNITGTTSGVYTNTTGSVSSTNGGTGNTATANLTVASPPTIAKAFGSASIPLNGSTSLTFTINNPNTGVALTGLAFTDSLPAGLVVATPNGLTNTCNGTPTATAGSGSVSLSAGTEVGSGSCTVSVNITGTTPGVKNNSVQVTSTEGGAGNTSNASITVVAPPVIIKAFGAASVPLNGSTSLQFTIQNNNATQSLSGIGFSDTFPAGLVVSTPNGLTGSCGGGAITATAGTNVVSLSGATLASSTSCTFTINVTGTTPGAHNNTTGNVTSTEGGTGGTASASLSVVAPPSIAKAFGAASIPLNGTTALTFTITNPAANTGAENGVAFTDTLPTGLVVATPNGLANSCGGTATATAGSTAISLTGASIATPGNTCTVVVNITGNAPGQYTNITGAVSSINGGTGNTATANLTVASPPTITKAFGAAAVPLNGSTSLAFNISNPNTTVPLTGVAFTDNLPAGLVVATPANLNNTCGGTAIAVSGATSASLSAGTLATNSSCTVSLNVTGTTAGVKNNSVQVSSMEGGTGNTSNTSITVVSPPVIIKAFGAASVPLNGLTSLQFTIQNNNATQSLSGIGFTDTFPPGLVVSTPNGLTGSCGGGAITATAGTNVVSLSGATLASSTSCTFMINVTGTTAGARNNTTGNVMSTEGGTGGTASASVNVIAPPSIAKAFSAVAISLNGTTSLTFTITNPAANSVAESGLAFTDTLPTGLVVATPSGLINNCGGTATAVAGSTSISLTGGSVAVTTSCTVIVNITGTASGVYTNTTGSVSSTNGGAGNTATANLTVASPPTIAKAFGAAAIPLNGTTSLTFNITNPNTNVALTGLAFTDNLPAGLVVASPPNLNNTCGGTATAVAGATSASVSAGTLAASASCTVSLNVTGATGGAKNNSVQVTSTEGGTGNTSNASITVAGPPVIIKAFGAASIPLNGSTSLHFTIQNNNATQSLSGIGFSDTLPAGLAIATPNGLTGNTCSTTPTAPQATNVVSLSGASLAASSSCTFSINVTGTAAGQQNNTTGNVTSTEGGTGGTASASINVVAPPSIAKVFNPNAIALNATTSLTFTITNPAANPAAETGVAFNDTLPTGLTVANSSVPVCGGTLTTTTPTGIALSGSSIAVNSQCQFSVTVTGAASGQYTNTTGAVSSTNGGTGNTATANLSVATPPTIAKVFGAAMIPLNGTTSLTFNITNSNTSTALTGLAFTDNLPAGLVVASPANLNDTCGGTATAVGGASSASLSAGTLAASGSCTVSLNVRGTTSGVKNNSVQVTSTEGGTGNTSNASITVAMPPVIIKAFGAASIPLNGTTSLQFTIQNNNTVQAFTGIGFSDTFPVGLVVATPNGLSGNTCTAPPTATQGTNVVSLSGASLAVSSSCTFSINVTGTAAGQQNNTTGNVTSTEGGTGGTASASLSVVAPPSIAKAFNPNAIALNATTSLTFTITNPAVNAAAETGVAFTDTLPTGLTVASDTAAMCGGTLTTTAPTSISLSGASVAANSQCQFSVTVTGAASGQYTNTTGAVSSTNGGTGNTATANLTVASPPTIAKAFGAPTIPLNGTTSLTFTLQNTNTTLALTGVAFGDPLPIRGRNNLVVATPNGLSGSCGGGTISATPGTELISLAGATLPASSSCTFSVNVTGNLAADLTNTTGNVTSNESGLGGTASASISVVGPPSIAKVFNPPAIALNATTTLTFTITNPAVTVGVTGVAFTDTLPTGLTVASGTAAVCGGTLTTTAPTSISLSGASVAANSQCQFSVTVTGATSGQYTNTTGAVSSTNGGTGNTATANLAVASPPTITKAFGGATVPLNGTTSLTFAINNPNTNLALTGLAFTDSLPAGLVVASPPSLSNTCGGTATAVGGSGSVSLSGGTAAASASCTVSVNVTGTTAGVKNNSVLVTSTEGGAGNTSNASITVTTPPTISKAFGAAGIPLNGSTSLTFTIQNGSTTTGLTGVAFSDPLPVGLVVATPNGLIGSCGVGTIAATAGSSAVSLTGGTIAANSSCSFLVNVTGTAPGQQNNTTGNVTSTEGGTGGTASASIKVEGPPSIAKAFNPSVIAPNTTSTLTFTITNPAANPDLLAGVSFADALPTGLVVATPNVLTNFCVGPVTAVAGSASISLSGGTVAANSNCTVSVNVISGAPGTYTNTTGAVSSANGGTGNAATAQLTVKNASLSIVKSHQGTFTRGQIGAQYTLTVSNAAAAGPTTGTVTVVDTLPVISNSHNLVPVSLTGTGWTCNLGTLTCTRSDALAPGASYPAITFTVNIPQDITNHFSNTATVSGGGDPNTHSGADPVNFGHALDITAITGSATVSAGTPAQYSFTVDATAAPSPLGTVTFSCANLPTAASCAFTPASESQDFATVALAINTTPRSTGLSLPFGLGRRPPMYALLLPGLGLAAIVFAGRRGNKLRLRLAMAGGALLLLALSGCGGGGGPIQNFTPSGTYTVTVNAVAGATTSSANVTLNVQ
jgi:mucin-19